MPLYELRVLNSLLTVNLQANKMNVSHTIILTVAIVSPVPTHYDKVLSCWNKFVCETTTKMQKPMKNI